MATDPNSVTLQQASDQYGELAQVLWNIPDLRGLLQSGIAQTWSPAYFMAQYKASPWYQQHSDTARQWILTQATQPAAWQQQLANTAEHVTFLANSLGRSVDANAVATQYLMNGWNDQQLNDYIGANGGWQVGPNGSHLGATAQTEMKLRETAKSYDIPVTDFWVLQAVNDIQDGRNSIDGFTEQLRQQAKAKYPHFAAQLDAGQTVAQIADPYIAQMGKTLELDTNNLSVDDPTIQRALSQRDPKSGVSTSMPMWQFDQQLKQDPRYAQTEQAHNDVTQVIHQIGKDFGYLS